MPLILISGYPSSGKTYRSTQLHEYFTRKIAEAQNDPNPDNNPTTTRIKRLKLIHISDDTLSLPRSVYASPRLEKDARATLSSAIKRALSPDTVVIADSLNYIKGFRYQLYCEAKALSTPNCVVHVAVSPSQARELNQQKVATNDAYEDDVLENLIYRYEEPSPSARWDTPLFVLPHSDPLPPNDAIFAALITAPSTIRPNAATVLKPASSSEELYELDRTTGEVVAEFVERGRGTTPQLHRLRRQYIGLNRQQYQQGGTGKGRGRVREGFVEFLEDALGEV